MRNNTAQKIIDYFNTLRIDEIVSLNDIGIGIGRKPGDGPSNCMKSHILPNCDGIIEEILVGRRKYYKVIGDTTKLQYKVENGSRVKRERTTRTRKTTKKGQKVIPAVKHTVGTDFSDDVVLYQKGELFGIYDNKEDKVVIEPSHKLLDLLGNYEKITKLSLISDLL